MEIEKLSEVLSTRARANTRMYGGRCTYSYRKYVLHHTVS